MVRVLSSHDVCMIACPSMGVLSHVHRSSASDTEENQSVAIKKITPMAGDEWDAKHTLREIRLMRYFEDHPNVRPARHIYIYYRYLERGSLLYMSP
jgi:hypothetical protein